MSHLSFMRGSILALAALAASSCNGPTTPEDLEVSTAVLERVSGDIRAHCTPLSTERTVNYIKTRFYCPAGDFYAVIYDGTQERMQLRVGDLPAARALFQYNVPAERMAGPKPPA